MTITNKTVPLRDVFYALSLAKPVPDAEILDDFIRRYPEHAAALTDFAIELVMDALRGDAESAEMSAKLIDVRSPVVSRAMSRFQNRFYALQCAKAAGHENRSQAFSVENPLAALSRASFRSLAQRLNASTVFVSKLRDRQIDPVTMTHGFCQRVADELLVSLDTILTHFAAPPLAQASPQYFKADQKPETGARQTFEEAVRSSGLTPDQQKYLLNL
jgi:hypothetical protein